MKKPAKPKKEPTEKIKKRRDQFKKVIDDERLARFDTGDVKIGRPTDYCAEYCQELVNHMARGGGFEAFCPSKGRVSASTLHNWCQAHPEFMESKGIGKSAGQDFWERVGFRGMCAEIPFFNGHIWQFNMQNRFGWRVKENVEHEGSVDHNVKGQLTWLEVIQKHAEAGVNETDLALEESNARKGA